MVCLFAHPPWPEAEKKIICEAVRVVSSDSSWQCKDTKRDGILTDITVENIEILEV